MHVTNDIPLGCLVLLQVGTVNCVQTLKVANNTLTHAPHTAITGGGNDHLFEYNTISHACFECTDTGAFYVGRSWSQRGNIVRYNVFDTIRCGACFRQKCTLEECHLFPSLCSAINEQAYDQCHPSRVSTFLPVHTVNCIETLKAYRAVGSKVLLSKRVLLG
jgi:hypothetical protein